VPDSEIEGARTQGFGGRGRREEHKGSPEARAKIAAYMGAIADPSGFNHLTLTINMTEGVFGCSAENALKG
jgi:hypothetical protein